MPTLTIGDKQVSVDDSFLKMSPDEQNSAVEEIASSLGGKKAAAEGVTTNSLVRATASGVPIVGGVLNSMNAATTAMLAPLVEPFLKDSPDNLSTEGTNYDSASIGRRFDKSLAMQEGADKKFSADHPILDTAAKLTGGAASLGGVAGTSPIAAKALGMTGESLLPMALRGATSGAVISGADAAVRGENPTHGAEEGAAFGAAGPVAGRVIGKVAGAVMNKLHPEPVVPERTIKVGNTEIPVTESQVSGDPIASAEEQVLLRGGRGERAQQVAQEHADLQDQRIGQAKDEIGSGLDPQGKVVADSPQDAGQLISTSVANKADQEKALFKQLYDDFGKLEGEIPKSAFENVDRSIKAKLDAGEQPIIVDDGTTPYAVRALADVKKTLGSAEPLSPADALRSQADNDAFNKMVAMGIPAEKARASLPNMEPAKSQGGIKIQAIDQARKRLVSIYQQAKASGNAADMRATQGVIKGLDDHIESTIDKGLFSGSELALPTLRAARQQFAYYKNTFGPQGPGDFVGQKMAKILGKFDGQAASPTDVANYLYGSTGINGTAPTIALAQRLKSVFGASSKEWSAVRQGLWSKLTEPAEGRLDWGPQKISERLHEFLNGNGKALAQVLFTQQERDLMKQLAGVYKQMIPVKGTTNPSGTAPMLAKIAKGAQHQLLPLLGFGHGGVPGAMVGIAADKALTAASNARAARKATKLFYGDQANRSVSPFPGQLAALLAHSVPVDQRR